jgi:hypothetical protein
MLGHGIPALSGTFKAYDADLNAKQFRVVDLAVDGIVDFTTASTDLALGIINNKPAAAAGADVEVVMLGECKAVAGGTITAGQFVVSDGNGELIAAPVTGSTVAIAVGRALESAVDNDIFRVFVNPCMIHIT